MTLIWGDAMTVFAFWLAFFSVLPVFYWIFKIFFERIRFILTRRHILTLEYTDENGVVKSDIIDVTSDDEFYRIAMLAIRSGQAARH